MTWETETLPSKTVPRPEEPPEVDVLSDEPCSCHNYDADYQAPCVDWSPGVGLNALQNPDAQNMMD